MLRFFSGVADYSMIMPRKPSQEVITTSGFFFLEQAAQLRLKALLLRLLDFIPREHGVRELLGVIIKYLESLGKRELSSMVSEYASLWRDSLRILEDDYIGGRYLAKTYESGCRESFKGCRGVIQSYRGS
jgi:HEPN domain-containing protein